VLEGASPELGRAQVRAKSEDTASVHNTRAARAVQGKPQDPRRLRQFRRTAPISQEPASNLRDQRCSAKRTHHRYHDHAYNGRTRFDPAITGELSEERLTP